MGWRMFVWFLKCTFFPFLFVPTLVLPPLLFLWIRSSPLDRESRILVKIVYSISFYIVLIFYFIKFISFTSFVLNYI